MNPIELNLLGEYECKVDAKGRFMLPAGLKKQLAEVLHEGFVLNRDVFEECLVLYPMVEWKKVAAKLNRLNRFVKNNAVFIRKFNNGATPLEIDTVGRLNLPNNLAESASITADIVVIGNGERIEIWDKTKYRQMQDEEIDFESLSEEVMGSLGNDPE